MQVPAEDGQEYGKPQGYNPQYAIIHGGSSRQKVSRRRSAGRYRPALAAAGQAALLFFHQAKGISQLAVCSNALLDIGVQLGAGFVKGKQTLLFAQFGKAWIGRHLLESIKPEGVIFVGHFRAYVVTANNRPLNI